MHQLIDKFKFIILIIIMIIVGCFLIYFLVPKKFKFYITTQPSDAKVTIDNQTSSQSPTYFKLNSGKHMVKITKAGYSEVNEEVDLKNDTALKFTLIDPNVEKFNKFLDTLPIKTNDYNLYNINNSLFVTFLKTPTSIYKDKILNLLKNTGIDPHDPNINIVWDTPAYLR